MQVLCDEIGAEANATTSHDETVYVTFEGERLRDPVGTWG